MTHLRRLFVTLVLLLCANAAAFAQTESIIVEAESGAVGSQFSIITEDGVTYAGIQTTIRRAKPDERRARDFLQRHVSEPGSLRALRQAARRPRRPSTTTVSTTRTGLERRTRRPMPTGSLANGLAGTVGFTLPSDKVVGGGVAQSNVWKWVKLSAFDGGERPVSFHGRCQQPDPDVSGGRPRKRAPARQVCVRTARGLLHRFRSRQRPARHDRSAPAAVHSARPADRDRAAKVPRWCVQPVPDPQLHRVLEPGDARERRQVGQRRRHPRTP